MVGGLRELAGRVHLAQGLRGVRREDVLRLLVLLLLRRLLLLPLLLLLLLRLRVLHLAP